MSFAARFLAGDPAATALLSDGFRRRDARAAAVQGAARRAVSPALVDALEAQMDAWGARPAQRDALRTLAQPGSVAVVTGQQVGLHLGPLYTLHKAAAAIVTARALAAETGRPCVPVFWLQTEDHDLAEIRPVALPGGALRAEDDGRDGVAVWHRRLGPDMGPLLDDLGELLGAAPHAAEVTAWLGRHYRNGQPWHAAFAGAVCELLGDEGLVLLDPRDPAVAHLAAPVLRGSVVGAATISRTLEARGHALREAGFTEQVHVRPGAPLAFFHPDGPEGPRARLDPDGTSDRWRLVGEDRTLHTDEVLRAADADPRALSSSALLRPVVQDSLLPTAMVLGGPGEIAYFAQLAPVYAHFGVPMPLVGPRASLRLIDHRARALLDTLGLTAADSARPREALLAELATRGGLPRASELRDELHAGVEPLLARFAERTTGLALADSVEKTRRTLHRALERLSERTERALATHDAVAAGRVDRLQALLQPQGAPQERTLGIAWHAARVGLRPLVAAVLAACEPFDGAMRDVELEPANGQ